MTNSGYNAHTNPIFQQHLILPFDLLIQQGQLSFMHAIDNNYVPKSFATTWIKNRDRDPNIALRNANNYQLVQPRTETYKELPYMPYLPPGMTFRHILNFKQIG